ncbi:aspartyl-tRNA synthetase, putative [Theileria annulata]|uniref:aspartate--tRNA ligase n=1 Tax=Theileria annulata TaxID=5874 RepID=Q4UBU0_THEAN|nr:aspartyl-tRNA synthetase, putative [Theileria annulata]CAI75711.1 aspartyl-tRNA synthetase, putative [Theileria annulata]|eukprot:XP_955187.1 aspartyl-tRNA synthetase, putative [Theileria annulata]
MKNPMIEKLVMNIEDKYGYVPFGYELTRREFKDIKDLDNSINKNIWIRGRIHELRGKGGICFLILRQQRELLQCVIDSKSENNTKDMVKWTSTLSFESIVDVYGKVVVPNMPILSTTSSSKLINFLLNLDELNVSKIFCISKSSTNLPFLLRDANNTDNEEYTNNPNVIKVNQDTRLDNRALDLRCFMNNIIFKIQSIVCQLYREFLLSNDFIEIHTPKLLSGSSEGGSSVFKFKYFEQDACLAQSPQLYKQMAICGDLKRVFEIGPVFRAENSNTHRHLCEYVGLDLEMELKNNYMEVVNLIDEMLKFVFNGLKNSNEINYFYKLNPSIQPFQFLNQTPKITFQQAVEMLNEIVEIPKDLNEYDFTTEHEKLLGKIIKNKYNTDYYIIYQYPLNVRPFYTMPLDCSRTVLGPTGTGTEVTSTNDTNNTNNTNNTNKDTKDTKDTNSTEETNKDNTVVPGTVGSPPKDTNTTTNTSTGDGTVGASTVTGDTVTERTIWSRSYDFFMRGEEILSGAQRIHDSEELEKRAKECGIDVNTIKDYIQVFKYASFPHAGAGIGLERVVMLFLGLTNIRKTSMFPRDPKLNESKFSILNSFNSSNVNNKLPSNSSVTSVVSSDSPVVSSDSPVVS